jgi:hypothetical protein
MAATDFYHLVDSLLPRPQAPWDIWDYAPAIHPVFFVHRVDGVTPGLYILVREAGAESRLRQALSDEFEWQKAEGCPDPLPLYRLQAGKWHKVARAVSCAQSIAADSCFSLGMLAEFEANVQEDAWRYRQLHWEAGMLGHVLYLEADPPALRSTGIGCFLDDAFHELLGLQGGLPVAAASPWGALTDAHTTCRLPDRIADMEDTYEQGQKLPAHRPATAQLPSRDAILVLDSRDRTTSTGAHRHARRLSAPTSTPSRRHFTATPVLLYCYRQRQPDLRPDVRRLRFQRGLQSGRRHPRLAARAEKHNAARHQPATCAMAAGTRLSRRRSRRPG